MAIEKMVSVTLAAKTDDFERVVDKYIYDRDIHLENAMNVLHDKKRLRPFDDVDQYDTIIKSAADILELANMDKKGVPVEGMTAAEMVKFLDDINHHISDLKLEKDAVTEKIDARRTARDTLDTMRNLNADIGKILAFEFIKFRFGHLPREGYKTLITYLDHLDTIFVKTSEDDNEIWGFYFSPAVSVKYVDEIFNSLYFERVRIPDGVNGTPREAQAQLDSEISDLEQKSAELEQSMQTLLKDSAGQLTGIYNTARKYKQFSEVRKNSAHSNDFFYVVGWMSKSDAQKLEKDVEQDKSITLIHLEDAEKVKRLTPPTKLKNIKLFKPFEFFVKMYGLPSYNEIDPTPILAVTYILFFGMMFGDVGQSFVLAVGGYILYKIRKWDLFGIVAAVGVSGIVFGFVYGSVFGNETLLESVRILSPMDSIWTLLLGTVAMGIVIICAGIILNMCNLWRAGKKGEMLFSHNGLAGILFYVSLMIIGVSAIPSMLFDVTLYSAPMGPLAIIMVVSLIAMYLEQPLSLLVEGKKDMIKIDGMFFVESFFELFEVLLSFFSNTISFLRIGAFAIVHAGMMMAVSVLAGDGGVATVIVQIFGNILVMVLEGLIVGIQVLRLEYYEMFSRYFTGAGKPFKSLKEDN